MKIFSILKPAVFRLHPQEDCFVISKKYPIFVVADGVTLNFDKNTVYPKNSGAGYVAKIFCETVLSEAEKRYENFEEGDLKEVFKLGNKAILEYNISQGRTKNTINYFDFDLFSATTSFLLIKNKKSYWWSVCDSGLQVFKNGEKIFQSPGGWINFPKDWSENKDDKKKVIIRHRDYRNAVKDNKLTGYGVVDGEKTAINYLNSGIIEEGDLFFLYTDGFENYFNLKEFISIFRLWPVDVGKELKNIISRKSKSDQNKYGREKTLIAISTDK